MLLDEKTGWACNAPAKKVASAKQAVRNHAFAISLILRSRATLVLIRSMMRLSLALFLFSFLSVASLHAQIEATLYGGVLQPRGGDLGDFGFARQPIQMKNGFKGGARLSLNSGLLTGHELSYGYERYDLDIGGQTESTATAQDFYYDFVLHLTPGAVPVRPFLLAGAGYTSFSPGNGGVFADASGANEIGVNFGGGVKVKVRKFFGVRFDVRNHLTRKPNFLDIAGVSGQLNRMEYSVGASFLF
jgi:hypothetical protein